MKKIVFVLGLLLSLPLYAADGMLVIGSSHGVAKTMDRLESIVIKAGFNVIARVNHSKAAKNVGIELKPIQLLIFGKPKAGSKLMQSQPTAALDLPMKYLVWKDALGKVNIGWNDPSWIASRHGVSDKVRLVKKMTAALYKLASKAAGND